MKPPIDVSRETRERLQAFVGLLLIWNRKINLVSRQDEDRVVERHVADALQLIPLLPSHIPRAIDVGTGGGFPGLILAIATGTKFELIEADKRKAAFLREAIRITNANATVHAVRVESASLKPAQLLTARAFAPLDRLLDLSHTLLAPGAILVLPKGETVNDELGLAQARWKMRVERFSSSTNPSATILRLSEVTRV